MTDRQPAAPATHMNPRIERDRQMIVDARAKGRGAMFKAFVRLSGPGWLQSGITLGGGSLASCLYLGTLVGFSFLWLQPVAMILGVVMLSAIAYVTLSTGQRPVRAINEHVNPVLGWGWLLAAMLANMIWSMPQFGLGMAAIRQNLLPGVFGPDVMPEMQGRILAACLFVALALSGSMLYGIGGRGTRIFELLVRGLVTLVVLCFLGVVIKLTVEGILNWREVLAGLVPDFGLLSRPAEKFLSHIEAVAPTFRDYWTGLIVGQQRDVMIGAAAAAVGINMTFMLPYSMLRKGWDRDFRGLAIFDLSTGLFIPFVLATSFVVMASATQFHAMPAKGLLGELDDQGRAVVPAKNLIKPFHDLLAGRLKYELGEEAFAALTDSEKTERMQLLPQEDKVMAAMLVKRDSFNLAEALAPLTGRRFAQYVFGLGVLGMVTGAATMLMTINGLCLCELLDKRPGGWTQRIGSLMVVLSALAPLFWNQAQVWLAVVASVFCGTLLPIAYFTFFMMMNRKSLLGDSVPTGGRRVLWNGLMGIACVLAAFGSLWTLWAKTRWIGIVVFFGFVALAVIVQIARRARGADGRT
ncbi:MAG: divalent metal cation transporter [Phycisphaerales bacterium]